eukprot:COSAG02_NODE_3630_length_6450_cov_2.006298_3_plen_78_part_00
MQSSTAPDRDLGPAAPGAGAPPERRRASAHGGLPVLSVLVLVESEYNLGTAEKCENLYNQYPYPIPRAHYNRSSYSS